MSTVTTPGPPASWAELIAAMPELREALLTSCTDGEKAAGKYVWRFWARKNQLPPAGNWRGWLMLTGRGFGKTRAGAEFVRAEVEAGRARHIALINDTASDTSKLMVTGISGLVSICPPGNQPHYNRSNRTVTWVTPGHRSYGAVATLFSAEAPGQLRGPEHDLIWADELGKWANFKHVDVQGGTAWDNALMGLRRGANPRWVITTTPRPIPVVKDLLKRAEADPGKIVVTRGSSYDNRRNLADSFFEDTLKIYEGTRLGRQEITGELLEDVPGALWTVEMLTRPGFRSYDPPAFTRVVVAVDPAVTSGEDSDETGIIAVGRDETGQGYVLADKSLRGRPHEWATVAVALYRQWHADGIIAEQNNGGEMVEHTIHTVDPKVPVKLVVASRGKRTRAEPVSALYEKGAVMHCGYFPALEEQMQNWVPDVTLTSPDRMDAMVWGLTELLIDPQRPAFHIL